MSEVEELDQLPAGCGYQGYEFGASYPDSECFGGRLYDMDNCDSGGIYEPGDDIPCPMCRPRDAISRYKEDNLLVMPFSNRRNEPRGYSKRNAARMARHLPRL